MAQGRDDLQRLTWRRSSPLSCDLLTETVSPCTHVRFFDRYSLTGSPMLFRIEEACHSQSGLEALEAPENGDEVDTWEATYQPFEKTKIKIHAVHLAASLGSTEVLQWLQDHCSPEVLAYQSIIESTSWENGRFTSDARSQNARPCCIEDCRMHYSPLLAALFMSHLVLSPLHQLGAIERLLEAFLFEAKWRRRCGSWRRCLARPR